MERAGRLLLLTGLLCAARGLRLITSPDLNCSQPGVRCSVVGSNCLDLSWIRRHDLTPAAPSKMEVTAGIGLDDRGYRVPVLRINWTASVDASILTLQGAEVSVLEVASGLTRCVQFQFLNPFPGQLDQNNQAWKFFYNHFEVNPGNKYQISVQHLPKLENFNRKEQEFITPGCSGDDMMMTDTCCRLGHCWSPNITLEFTGSSLMVTFSPRPDAQVYGVQVRIVPLKKTLPFERVALHQGATTERVQVNLSNPVRYDPCWYNVSVWPYMLHCETDCVRQWYTPKCLPSLPEDVRTIPIPPGPGYVWPIAAAVMIMAFTVTILLLWRARVDKVPIHPPPPVAPPLVKQVVWLVYSADHELYINAVIRLADFLRVAWGLDVVMDRHQSHEIGIKGAMAWLGSQKDQIEKVNGTILILCSRGAQAKWRAMQNGQEARVTLPEDTNYAFGDLFTPALALILPDFQRANPYDRYLVAYFSDLCDIGDIPSPLEICPRYALIENLQLLLFRIQRIEHQQPNVQYNVDLEGEPSYRHLAKAVEKCRAWQETHSDWFGLEYSLAEAKDEEEDTGQEFTQRVYPQIRQLETSISMLTPRIIEPASIRSVNPSLVVGPSSVCVVPLLYEERSPVTVVQPSLNMEALRASYRQQPYLVNVDESLPFCNERLRQMDLSGRDVQSEDLSELQKRVFCQNISGMNANVVFPVAGVEDSLTVNEPLLPIDSSTPPDQGIPSLDLREAQKMLFCQSILGDQPGAPNMVFNEESLFSSDGSVYERLRQIDLSIQRDQDVLDLRDAQKKFFVQTLLDDQHLAPDMVFDAELSFDADVSLETPNEPLLQNDGQGAQSLELRETQKNQFKLRVLESQTVTTNVDVHADGIDIYEEPNDLYRDFQCSHVVAGLNDNVHCQLEDLGYGSWLPDYP